LWCIHRELFSDESIGERILKIGPHLPKLVTKIILFEAQCIIRLGLADLPISLILS